MPTPTPTYDRALDAILWRIDVPSQVGHGRGYRVAIASYDGAPARAVVEQTWRGGVHSRPLRSITAVDLPAVIAALDRAREYLAGTHT